MKGGPQPEVQNAWTDASRLPQLGPRGEDWVALQVVLFVGIGVAGFLGPGLPGVGVVSVLGAVLIVGGGLLIVQALRDLGASLSPLPRPGAGNRPVETGTFRFIRHPIYSGLVLVGAGSGILTGSWPALALTAPLRVVLDAKSRREEAWLVEVHPEHAAYRTRTRRFVPWSTERGDTPRVSHQSAAGRHRNRLAVAMAVSVGILAIELFAGIAGNSLALMADAGHVFADVSGMALSLGAIWLANRPTSGERSFGLYRAEILAATANALLLLGVSGFVIWEGVRRLFVPPEIDSGLVVVVAAVALGANLVSMRQLAHGRRESLTMRGAYLEVLGDLVGSVAVLAAGVAIIVTGFRGADAIASILIGVLIVPRTVGLLRDSIDVLLEATPKGINLEEVRRHILGAPGIDAVHDLHAWTITSGMNVVSAHVVLRADGNPGAVLDHLGMCLADDFDVDHSTFQLETADHVLWEGRASQVRHKV